MIYGEDPLRRRSRNIDGEENATGGVCLNGGKSGQMVFRTRADLQNRAIGWLRKDGVRLAVDQWYDFHEYGCHLGNVGLGTASTPPLSGSSHATNSRRRAMAGTGISSIPVSKRHALLPTRNKERK